ncbi:MAG: hypothetical protein QNK04_05785 [Myxococcota bacterium]|nr:hypothetical protein [Myxococcota bacterium]
MTREREVLLRATEALLLVIGDADAARLEAAIQEREQALTALRSAAGSRAPLGSDEASQRLRALERELLAVASDAREAAAAELREVRGLRRNVRRLRGRPDARFFESRV